MTWSVEHLANDLFTTLAVINLLNNPLVDRLALAAQAARELERRPFRVRHHQELLNNRLNELYRARGRLNVVVVVMSIFLDPVQRIFKLVLAMGDETRVLRRPSRVRRPLVVQDAIAELVATTAGLLTLTFWQEAVAGAQRAAVRQVDNARRLLWFQINDLILGLVDMHEALEPGHQLGVGTNVPSSSLDKDLSVDKISRI